MFDVPKPYRAPRRQVDPTVTRWAKFKGHFTCDLCIMDIHDGISTSPMAQAKHSLTKGTRRWLLCSVHAAQVRNGERKLNG